MLGVWCQGFYCAARSGFAGRSGAQRNEESANREGVASDGATQKFYFCILFAFLEASSKLNTSLYLSQA